jgi:signal transduction histidine kinase
VIAGGRLLLACLFLVAVWADGNQPARAHEATYGLLLAYVAWSLGVTLFVWNDWWNDARLAAPAHVIDVAVFMIMLYTTQGYDSPYFTFFIFILLAAAIRWGWKETSITAAAIIAVYFSVGLLLGDSPRFESERFIIRTGHLFIISAILIWFGANQWVAWPQFRPGGEPAGPAGGSTFDAALQAGMAAAGADRALLLWREAAGTDVVVASVTKGAIGKTSDVSATALPKLAGALLFDIPRDRVLLRAGASRWHFLRASEALPAGFADLIGKGNGLAVPFAGGTVEGLAIFQNVKALSTDHLDFAPRLARDVAERLQDAALFAAAEERSMAQARVAVARDLHDSVVQFLSGLGFQLEALNRSPEATGALGKTLADLKEAVMTEQRHLRAFIRGLKTGGSVSFRTLSRDCASLCELLARQWGIECLFSGKAGPGSVPMRTQLDVHHLIREAVANAARHGGAKQVRVSLSGDEDDLRLAIADDGGGFEAPAAGLEIAPPSSLSGRVMEAGGELDVASKPGETIVEIRLPAGGSA